MNNAGFIERATVEETEYDSFDRHMKTNVYGPYFLCKAALPLLRRSDAATIFNVCSIVSVKAYEHQAAYTVSKHAVYGLTKVLAREMSADDIRVYAVLPGLVSTELAREARPEVPLSNMTSPEDLAEWMVFMALQGIRR